MAINSSKKVKVVKYYHVWKTVILTIGKIFKGLWLLVFELGTPKKKKSIYLKIGFALK